MSKSSDSTVPDPDLPFSTTIMVRDTCLCLHLQRAARSVARRFDDALRPSGLTNGQFSLLMSLNRPQPPLMRDVAELLAMDRTTLTAMLKPLSRRGMVKIEPDAQDRRGKRLILEKEGIEALKVALPIWTRTHADIERSLSQEAQELREQLRQLG